MKPFPWKCASCREKGVEGTILPHYTAGMEHDGKKYQVAVDNLPVLQCKHCHEVLLTGASTEMLEEALRAEVGLLRPAEIRQYREALKLTQKQVANALRLSESSLSRWETGFQIQQRSMDTYLRAFFALEELRSFLGITVETGVQEATPVGSPSLFNGN